MGGWRGCAEDEFVKQTSHENGERDDVTNKSERMLRAPEEATTEGR